MSSGNEWRGDWENAELEALRAGLAATPEQRLEWLEDALRFAWEAGALPEAPRSFRRVEISK